MKVAILAGGLGTRISEETGNKPKPMVLIGKDPILWHIMNIFIVQGMTDFVIALGYLGEVIEEWLKSLPKSKLIESGIDGNTYEFQYSDGKIIRVSGLKTGLDTQTGGRVARVLRSHPGESFIFTYGDGLANVSVRKLLRFHRRHGKIATVTAVRPPARFGYLDIHKSKVIHFGEKNQSDSGWINGGFFVFDGKVESYVAGDHEPFELGALPKLASQGQLMAFEHSGFWQPMDTLREKMELIEHAKKARPPWIDGIGN